MTTAVANVGREFLEAFKGESQQQRLKDMLPDDVSLKRFTAVVIRAVQENPVLLDADRKSLFLACQRAAQDGLIPDGREGFLNVYNTKRKVNGKDQWFPIVEWQPMIGGLRKRLAKLGWDLTAKVVHENDFFEYEEGDDERIVHKPPQLGQPRGVIIGAYAIATEKATGIKYREVMDRETLNAISKLSKGGVWGTDLGFPEMCRKAVAKRLYKSLPVVDDLMGDIVERDNENYEFPDRNEQSPAAQLVQDALTAPEPEPEFDESENPAPIDVFDDEDDPLA